MSIINAKSRFASTPGELLQFYRNRLGLSQAELAQKLDLKNDRTIRYWETSYYIPRPAKLKQLLELLVAEDKLADASEASRLWQIVADYNELTEKTRTGYPEFDRKWFDQLLKQKNLKFPHPAALVPLPLFPVVGRTAEIEQALARLEQPATRLLTLTGPGGVGKTRLALEIAGRLNNQAKEGEAGAVLVVSLVATANSDLVLDQLARSAGIVPGAGDKPENILAQVKVWLEKHYRLLVLDNFEQVLAAAGLVAELLKTTSRLKIVVTSRVALDIYGEYQFEIKPLALPGPAELASLAELAANPAVSLFVQRAQARTPGFSLNEENAAAIARICHKLDGLPLALELAAARTRLFTPQAILDRLDSRFKLLVGSLPDNNPRHHSLQATLDWSYQLLEENLRPVFCRLALFGDGFELSAAEAVNRESEPGLETWQTVEQLIVHSLLFTDTAHSRYRMLEIVREYARLQLAAQPELESAARQSYFDYYLGLAREIEPYLNHLGDLAARERLSREYNNLRQALEWAAEADPAAGLELSATLGVFWYEAGLNKEANHWLTFFLGHPANREPSAARAKALQWVGSVTFVSGEFEASRAFTAECLDLGRRFDYTEPLGPGLFNAASLALMEGRFDEADRLADEGLALGQRINYPWDSGMAYFFKSLTLMAQGRDWEQARVYLEESLRLQRPEKYATVIVVLSNLGLVAARLGDLAYAQQMLEESIELSRANQQPVHITYGLTNLGMLLYRQDGEASRKAVALFLESLEISLNARQYLQALNTLVGLAAILALPESGQPAGAVRLLSAVEALGRNSGGGLEPSYQQAQVYRETYDHLKESLDPPGFAANWRAGQALTFENILATCRALFSPLASSSPA